jgi:diacylglycerol kinase family enzyme
LGRSILISKAQSWPTLELKNFLGGGAYTLMGMLKAIDFVPYKGSLKTPDFEMEQTGVVAAVCNGKQAGGGQVLAPKAKLNDGLLDVMIVKEFSLTTDLSQLKKELENPSLHGQYIQYFQTPWLESHSQGTIPVNLDGEPYLIIMDTYRLFQQGIQVLQFLPDASDTFDHKMQPHKHNDLFFPDHG